MPYIGGSTIAEVFQKRVKEFSHQVAFTFKKPDLTWEHLTFQQFYEECRLLSCGLREIGLKPGSQVALISKTRIEWSLLDWAVLGCGSVVVPIHPTSSPMDIDHILKNSKIEMAFIEHPFDLDKLQDAQSSMSKLRNLIVIDPITRFPPSQMSLSALRELGRRRLSELGGEFDATLTALKPSDIFTVCYTSGTTGTPKGAVITHENLMSVLHDCQQVFADYWSPENEVILSYLPFSHILGRVESMSVFAFGWRQIFSESLEALKNNLKQFRPTLLFGVPWIFQRFYSEIRSRIDESHGILKKGFGEALKLGYRISTSPTPFRPLLVPSQKLLFWSILSQLGGRLRTIISGGAPLPKEISEFFFSIGIKVYEGYGLTETCGPVTLNTPNSFKFGSVGKPLPDVSVKIQEDGEILIHSKKVFKGYFNSDAETKAALKDGWLCTGDVGEIDSDGFLMITDRKKDLIVLSTGENVAPQKIENLAKASEWFEHVFVYGDNKAYLTALLTLNSVTVLKYAEANQILFSGYRELIRNLKMITKVQKVVDEINESLGKYEKIKKFLILPEAFSIEKGEVSLTAKLRRKEITEHYKEEIERLYR